MKVLVINGPNLNLLHKRDTNQYGSVDLEGIHKLLVQSFPEDTFSFIQSNSEGEIIDRIQAAEKEVNGIIINPGGYAHSSVAIRDALELLKIPKIEVHLSNLAARENYRQSLITAAVCDGYISGFKENSYFAAVILIKRILHS